MVAQAALFREPRAWIFHLADTASPLGMETGSVPSRDLKASSEIVVLSHGPGSWAVTVVRGMASRLKYL
jgi:hypothetical protein